MDKHELQVVIEELHGRYKDLRDGQLASYIPELEKADPEAFGIALVSSAGQVFEAGDCDRPFTIQSISKPFTFGLAIEAYGHDRVSHHVGVEPSGDAFNAIELQSGTNRPRPTRRGSTRGETAGAESKCAPNWHRVLDSTRSIA